MSPQLVHENSEAYRTSLAFIGWVTGILRDMTKPAGIGVCETRDQLQRAALSVSCHIAEGSSQCTGMRQRDFFQHAHGSAMECAACLDALVAMSALTAEQITEGKQLLQRMDALLTELPQVANGASQSAPTHDMPPRLLLILGGARSGKSTFAEQLAAARGPRVTYLATAQAFDDEMAARIAKHQADRPAHWQTAECPLDPAAAIRAHAAHTDTFLLDCLTLLVSNLLLADALSAEARVQSAVDALLTAYREAGVNLILVSNEVGLGLVPEYALGRQYRDLLGKVNQRIAAQADAVYFLVAGLPLDVKALACSPIPVEEPIR